MKKLVVLWVALILSVAVEAQEIAPARDSKPIPDAVELKSDQTLSEAIPQHLVSWAYEAHFGKHGSPNGIDLTEDLVVRVRNFIRDARVPNSAKSVVMLAYGVGDPRIQEVLLEAKAAGVGRVTLMMDLARALSPNFKKDERFSGDFESAPYSVAADGELKDEAKIVKNLRAQGFTYAVGSHTRDPYVISSPPVHNGAVVERPPLYHLKGLLLLVEPGVAHADLLEQAVISTHNPTLARRNNRALVLTEPQLIRAFAAGVQNHVDTFGRGERIKETSPFAPTRVEFKDGSSAELRWTDGKYDINFAIADTLKSLSAAGHRVVGFYGSWFAATYRPLLEALRTTMEANPELSPLVVGDDGFSDVVGWGIVPPIAGFDVLSDSSTQMRPFADRLADRVRAYIYQRSTLDEAGKLVPQLSEEGPPKDRWVHHDKTTVIVWVDAQGKERARIFTGSMNPSGNYHNAEVQLTLDLQADHPRAREFVDSIQALPIQEANYCVPAEVGMFRNAIGRITGHSDREIDEGLARRVRSALLARDRGELMALLTTISGLPSALEKRPSEAVVANRLQRLDRFFALYFEKVPHSRQSERFRIRRLTQLAILLTQEDLSAYRTRVLIERILWRPNLTDEQVKALVDPVARILVGPLVTLERRQAESDVISANVEVFKKIQGERIAAAKAGRTGLDDAQALRGFVMDHDDTLMRMVTKIRVFHRQTGESREISTGEWARVRNEIGKPGPWQDYQVNTDPLQGSFADFNNEQIVAEMRWILQNVAPRDWQGWSLLDFYKARLAGNPVWILTARRPSVPTALAAYGVLDEWFESKTGIKVPPLRPDQFVGIGGASDPSMAKAERLVEIAQQLNERAASLNTTATLGFSDDDAHNAMRAVEVLRAKAEKGAWPALKIVVFKVQGVEGYPYPAITVIEPNGTLRPPKGRPEALAALHPPQEPTVIGRMWSRAVDGVKTVCEKQFGSSW